MKRQMVFVPWSNWEGPFGTADEHAEICQGVSASLAYGMGVGLPGHRELRDYAS